jgi:predicted nucleic acid-binding Zn ribbon protein
MNRGELMPERELTKSERDSIRELVVKMCANYHYQYGCLPLETDCYMLGKWWTGAFCKYFAAAVLPLNPALEVALASEEARITHKICPVCGTAYFSTTSQAYCSDRCRIIKQREDTRQRQRKRREKQRK